MKAIVQVYLTAAHMQHVIHTEVEPLIRRGAQHVHWSSCGKGWRSSGWNCTQRKRA
jgi:hypothetical protein